MPFGHCLRHLWCTFALLRSLNSRFLYLIKLLRSYLAILDL